MLKSKYDRDEFLREDRKIRESKNDKCERDNKYNDKFEQRYDRKISREKFSSPELKPVIGICFIVGCIKELGKN